MKPYIIKSDKTKKEESEMSAVDRIFLEESLRGIQNCIMPKKEYKILLDFFDKLTLEEKLFLRGFVNSSGKKTFTAFHDAIKNTHARARDNAHRLKKLKGDPGKETWWLWLGYFAGKEM